MTDRVNEERIFRIIRFRFNGRPRTIRNNVTLAEAQAHCSRPDTSSHDGQWFDGYDYIRGYAPKAERRMMTPELVKVGQVWRSLSRRHTAKMNLRMVTRVTRSGRVVLRPMHNVGSHSRDEIVSIPMTTFLGQYRLHKDTR